MVEGWILDTYLDEISEKMVLWIKEDCGKVTKHFIGWTSFLHVKADSDDLKKLESKLRKTEYQMLYGDMNFSREHRLTSHENYLPSEVLRISLTKPSKIKQVADVISALGDWDKYEIFSVDSKLSQRFLLGKKIFPFGKIRISGDNIIPLDVNKNLSNIPPLKLVMIKINAKTSQSNINLNEGIYGVSITDMGILGKKSDNISFDVTFDCKDNQHNFIEKIEQLVNTIDPDVIVTFGGDNYDFPTLMEIASDKGQSLKIGRNMHGIKVRRRAVTTRSYGRIIRSDAYHALEGRIHIDMSTSFIGKEGGIEGICELSQMSCIPAQDVSRLSPGSIISAVQIKQSMEDEVLVPWKKNRPEDFKTGTQMLISDRGGFYLDPKPGIYQKVYELDFASLFPSIIATRNISPETMNCRCCEVSKEDNFHIGFLPINPEKASKEIKSRQISNKRLQLLVPEIYTHTCTKRYGFLGRVVAPIIQRRKFLKSQVKSKNDSWDRRQNVLKWLLVTCFGYTGYRNARFGRIECHEAICAWSRKMIIDAMNDAEEDGWECLHAIVDSIWLVDSRQRNSEELDKSITNLMSRIESKSGVTIELEDIYDWIAFVPNKSTGVGSLNKYFAYGQKGWKIRGVELRQHSTCKWIKEIQTSVLEKLREGFPKKGVRKSIDIFHQEILRLRNNEIPISELIIARRVQYNIGENKVLNLTAAALLREAKIGDKTFPGQKIRFVVVGKDRKNPSDRIRLKSEIELENSSILGQKPDFEYYHTLALRATFALLSPFGISEDDILSRGCVQTTLDTWLSISTSCKSDM